MSLFSLSLSLSLFYSYLDDVPSSHYQLAIGRSQAIMDPDQAAAASSAAQLVSSCFNPGRNFSHFPSHGETEKGKKGGKNCSESREERERSLLILFQHFYFYTLLRVSLQKKTADCLLLLFTSPPSSFFFFRDAFLSVPAAWLYSYEYL